MDKIRCANFFKVNVPVVISWEILGDLKEPVKDVNVKMVASTVLGKKIVSLSFIYIIFFRV